MSLYHLANSTSKRKTECVEGYFFGIFPPVETGRLYAKVFKWRYNLNEKIKVDNHVMFLLLL